MFREIQYLNIYKQYAMFVGHPVPSTRSSVQRPSFAVLPFGSRIPHSTTSMVL